MEIGLLPQTFLNGLMLAMFYIIIALGLTLVFSILRIINFAHGEFYMIGGYIVYFFIGQYHLNYILTFLFVMISLGIFGVIIERVLLRRFLGQLLNAFIVTLGLSWALQSLALLFFGSMDRSFQGIFPGVIKIMGMTFSLERIIVTLCGFGLVVLLHLFIRYTKTGQAMRAVAQDPDAASVQGISVGRICSVAFFIGSALAGAAGALIAPVFMVSPTVGDIPLIKAFVIIILGGMGSIPGALIAGVILGMFESFGTLLMTVPTVELLTFALVVVTLIFRPKGLFGVD